MSLNWKEIDAVLAELDLAGAQIQKITQSAYDVLALSIYKEGKSTTLLLVLTPGACRLHATYRAVPKSEKPLRFAELLKSRVKDARIESCRQLGSERIVVFKLYHGEERFKLYARLWSNAANVILTDEAGAILDAMRRSPRRGEVSGGVYRPEETLSDGSAPQREFQVRDLEGDGSFNERVDRYYAEHGGALSLDALREQVTRVYNGRIARLQAAIEDLAGKQAQYERNERWKQYGDIVMAAIGTVAPGAEWLETLNFYTDEQVRIRLNPRQNLPENAEHYFQLYRKEKSALEGLAAELAESRAEKLKLEAELAKLLCEGNPLRLLAAQRSLRVSAKTKEKKRPGLSFRVRDWLLLVGRDAKENDELLRHHVKGADLWLHTRDVPGGYVFVRNRSVKNVPLDILLDAGNLAVFYSKARNAGEADLYYTPAKYLRRAKNGPRGLVIPTHEKNLHVKLDEARIKRLEKCREEG